MLTELARAWTLDELADRANTSRATLVCLFQKAGNAAPPRRQADDHVQDPADPASTKESLRAIFRKEKSMDAKPVRERRAASNQTPTGLSLDATRDLSGALNVLLADMFALYLKTKNFHWLMSGSHFRDYHLLLDEQGEQIFAATDDIAERVRKIGGTTLRSIGHIARLQRVSDNDADYVTPLDMLAELRDDNRQLVARMRETHGLCDEHGDVASASLLENWIDEAERRAWFLFEATRTGESSDK
jgi:starvation-inducible DNA-binding protein